MNYKKLIFSFLLLLLTSFGDAPAKDSATKSHKVSKKYEGEKEVVCGGKTYKIPLYLPYEDTLTKTNIYLDAECTESRFVVYWGFAEGCYGRNVCSIASFSYEKISNYIAHRINLALNNKRKNIEIDDMVTGYYVPSVCYAYCNEMSVLWLDAEHIYIIGSKMHKGFAMDSQELKKSALSYIQH
ncbi:MAG: hypothetical protein EAY76_00365 [Alphaproteobacteria bacterium]|nr:MAG: hypothetical protein EAY76_00365 [Alphaproteobacteria bacterium]TAF38776.1 MAG: hypothetical protein EAZ66_05895 [Alphaproteobacteria bacterium]